MTPQQFITKWTNSPIKERAAAQEHFLDICRMLGEPSPADVDPTGLDYGFEVGASKTTGGKGFADVFKRGHFGWEYKGTKANLDAAFAQLQRYAIALDNPPLLIVSDIGTTIRIHTNWTNSVSKVYTIPIAELGEPEKLRWLKAALSDPDALRPAKTRQELTEEVAGEFARLARSLRERGHPAEAVAHFVNRLVFCMFAEDVRLLPDMIFSRMLERALETPAEFVAFARDLFMAMKGGGRIGFERVAWFNGGLFDDDTAFDLTKDEIKIVKRAASFDWAEVDPSILGTLPENRGRSLLGIQKSGPFDVEGLTARRWLALPLNPNGRPNADVLKPYRNGDEIMNGSTDRWLIDLPSRADIGTVALWEAPFSYLEAAPYDPNDPSSRLLRDERQSARDRHARERWWEPYWPRPEMRSLVERLPRYIVTGETTEHRVFTWLSYPVLPDKNLIVFPRDDDTAFGILHSRFHEAWTTAIGNRMGAGNQRRYNNLTCFETFPFPAGLTPDVPAEQYSADPRAAAISEAARRLNELRENWLNPADLVRREPEVVPGYPDRIRPAGVDAEKELRKRTLTNLYNAQPAWLQHAHEALDEVVAAAYGWPADLKDEEMLARLFALNRERSA